MGGPPFTPCVNHRALILLWCWLRLGLIFQLPIPRFLSFFLSMCFYSFHHSIFFQNVSALHYLSGRSFEEKDWKRISRLMTKLIRAVGVNCASSANETPLHYACQGKRDPFVTKVPFFLLPVPLPLLTLEHRSSLKMEQVSSPEPREVTPP